MYNNELCPRCYGEDLHQSLVGIWCADCEPAAYRSHSNFHWVVLHNCDNCGSKYDPPYNMFANTKEISKGCWNCIPKDKRL